MIRNFINIVETTGSETEAENHRVLSAYRKKNRISINDLVQMSDEEIKQIWSDALTNRHLYPIPTTEPEYLYHGTAKARLPQIVRDGLVPSEKSRWTRSGLAYHSLGRVFFADSVSKAEFYARNASRTRHVILRVRRDVLTDMHSDTMEADGCYFVERTVPSTHIEVWSGQSWSALSS